MSRSSTLNYHRDKGYKSNEYVRYDNELSKLADTPTDKQKRFHCFLAKTCEENGITPISGQGTKQGYRAAINKMKAALYKAGVEWNDTTTKKPKYGYNKRGEIIDLETRKVIKR